MTLTETLQAQLDAQGLSLTRFRDIVGRMYAAGILVRDEDGVEERLYDDMRRIEPLLVEYFRLGGFTLAHDGTAGFFRLYAPGAEIPGADGDEAEAVPGLRARLSADFVAAALALRFLYQQGLADAGGRLTDAGEVLIRFEELAATLQTQLRRPLPGGMVERQRLLADLKRHRLVRVNPLFSMEDEDALLAVRPTILGIISDDMLARALEADDAGDAAANDDIAAQGECQ
jgi:hypothetical protein